MRDCRPPDSIRIRSRSGNARSSRSAAAMFSVGSSRITVCGQAPAWTARTRSGGNCPPRRSRSASSSVTRSLVMTAVSIPPAARCGRSASIRAVLPDPTGPPMHTRAAVNAGNTDATSAPPARARRSAAARRRAPRRCGDRPRHAEARRSGACRPWSARAPRRSGRRVSGSRAAHGFRPRWRAGSRRSRRADARPSRANPTSGDGSSAGILRSCHCRRPSSSRRWFPT